MINHQSPYGQIIKISSEEYYQMSDDELKETEIKYANSNKHIIYFNKVSVDTIPDFFDTDLKFTIASDDDDE